jgi:hypothetical protein
MRAHLPDDCMRQGEGGPSCTVKEIVTTSFLSRFLLPTGAGSDLSTVQSFSCTRFERAVIGRHALLQSAAEMGTLANLSPIVKQLKRERDLAQKQLSGLDAAFRAITSVYSGGKPRRMS